MMHSLVWYDAFRGLPLLLRGDTTPEDGSIFSENSIMHSEGSVEHKGGKANSKGVIILFRVSSRFSKTHNREGYAGAFGA